MFKTDFRFGKLQECLGECAIHWDIVRIIGSNGHIKLNHTARLAYRPTPTFWSLKGCKNFVSGLRLENLEPRIHHSIRVLSLFESTNFKGLKAQDFVKQ